MKIKFYIKEGGYRFTGRKIAGWTVHGLGHLPVHFQALKDAKGFAIQNYGASGQWKAEKRNTGSRGRMERHYFDAQEEVNESE